MGSVFYVTDDCVSVRRGLLEEFGIVAEEGDEEFGGGAGVDDEEAGGGEGVDFQCAFGEEGEFDAGEDFGGVSGVGVCLAVEGGSVVADQDAWGGGGGEKGGVVVGDFFEAVEEGAAAEVDAEEGDFGVVVDEFGVGGLG